MIAAVVGVLGRCMRIIRRHDRETRQRMITQWAGTPDQLADTFRMMDAIVGMRYSATQSALDELSDYKPVGPARDKTAKPIEKERALKEQEIKRLFAACTKQGGALGVRNQVILALGIGCGLRRSEIAKLRFEDVDWGGMSIGDDPYLPIQILDAKGEKDRTVNAANGTRQSLLQWRAVRGEEPGPLLYSFDRWTGMQRGLAIDGQTVYNVLADLADLAEVKRPAPHDMRRTFVSNFIATTGDISMASKLAGHASVTTTQRYDKRGDEEAASAIIEAVHVPFQWIAVQSKIEQAAA
jgi:integrase